MNGSFPDIRQWGDAQTNVLYETETGRIRQISASRNLGRPILPEGWSELITNDVPDMNDPLTFRDNYVADGAVRPRPLLTDLITVSKTDAAADDVDSCVISGLPDPCEVAIDGAEHEVVGGTLTLTGSMPATYTVAIEHWPYMPWVQSFTFGEPE